MLQNRSDDQTAMCGPAEPVRDKTKGWLWILYMNRTVLNTSFRIVYPFLPSIARGLGISLTAASRLVTLRMVPGIGAPLIGLVANRYDRRRMMEVALLILTLASLLLAGIGTLAAAAIAFTLYGIAHVLQYTVVYAYVGDVVPYHERGRAFGIIELSWSSAWLLGVPISGFLIERFGWRAPWGTLILLGLLGVWLTHSRLPPTPRLAAGESSRPLLGSTISILRNLLRRRSVIAVLLTTLFLTMAFEVPFIVYGAWLEVTFGLGLTTLGLASTVVGLANLAGEVGATVLTDRFGKRRSVLAGVLGFAASLIILPWFSGIGLAPALAAVALMMLTFEFAIVSFMPIVTEVAPDARASLLSLRITALSLGRILGALLGGWLWQRQSIALNAGLGAGFALAAALLLSSRAMRLPAEEHSEPSPS